VILYSTLSSELTFEHVYLMNLGERVSLGATSMRAALGAGSARPEPRGIMTPADKVCECLVDLADIECCASNY